MKLILVHLIVVVFETLLLPIAVVACLVAPKLKSTLVERLGWGAWCELSRSDNSHVAWIHAASMGEVTGITPVVNELRKENIDAQFIFTTTSTTGKAEVLKRFPESCAEMVSRNDR